MRYVINPMKKCILLSLVLSLFITPVFASGHGLEGLAILAEIFMVVLGIQLLGLIVSIIYVFKKSKKLGVFGWVLTILSFIFVTLIGGIGNEIAEYCLLIPSLSSILLLKGRQRNYVADDTRINTKDAWKYLPKAIAIFILINIVIYFGVRLLINSVASSDSMYARNDFYAGISVLSTAVTFFSLLLLTRKALISRITGNEKVSILQGIASAIIIYLPVWIIQVLLFVFTSHASVSIHLLWNWLTSLLYATVIGIVAYFLVYKRK